MRRHKASGRAYVTINGEQHYLGQWGSDESRRAFRDIIARWESSHGSATVDIPMGAVKVADLARAFLDWAGTRYRNEDGTPTSEIDGTRRAIADVVERHGRQLADTITGRDIRQIQTHWKAQGFVRTTLNTYLGRVKRMFRWGAKNDLVAEATAAKIAMVDGIRRGEARDNDEVGPVPLRDLVKTLRQLKPKLAAMARVQYYCGARPGEVCRMRGNEIRRKSFRIGSRTINIPEDVAIFLPARHKTVKKGQTVFYTLGPRAQAAIAPYLAGDGFIFPGQRIEHVDYSTYALAIQKAAERAGVKHWSPNQLRHNFLTRMDTIAGIQAGSAAVRHKSLDTTAIYVQSDLKAVAELAAKHG
jgi:integrase